MSLNWIFYLVGMGLLILNFVVDVNNPALWIIGVVLAGVGLLMDVVKWWKKKQGKKDDEPKT